MAKSKKQSYVCQSCGAEFAKWMGRCTQCQSWNTVALEADIQSKGSSRSLVRLSEVEVKESFQKQSLGLEFLDRILGGGLPSSATVLLAGQPGIGKSTLLFQMLSQLKSKILYVSAEESVQQIANRFHSQKQSINENFYILTENRISDILQEIDSLRPEIVAVDSIQMLSSDSLDRAKGGAASIREVAESLVTAAKTYNFTLWIVGHVTKDGEIAGPKTLEHLVDSVLLFSSAEEPHVRLLQTQKHRFGQSGELAVLEISEKGLAERPGAETYWLQSHTEDMPGCAFAAVLLGSRVYCVEIQALCASTHFPSPRRSTTGFDLNRLYLILAVLEKKLKIPFSNHDVYLNVVGGLKLSDPGVDLAVAAALVSAQTERAVCREMLYCGEIGLTGEVRRAPSMLQRAKAAAQVGKTKFICAKSKEFKNLAKSKTGPSVISVNDIHEALKGLL